MKLEECRKVIDAIDTEILALLNRRASLSGRMGQIKLGAGLPIVDEKREEMILRRLVRENDGDIADSAVIGIYRQVLDESRRIQAVVVAETVEGSEVAK